MTGKPQFTPRQILDAGLRAESVNQLDHAAQFFQFLLEHHARSPEATAARDHLQRVSAPRAPEPQLKLRAEARPEPRPEPRGDVRPAAPSVLPVEPGIRPTAPPPPYTNGHAAMPASWADAGPSPFASPRLDDYAAPFQPPDLGSGYGGSSGGEQRPSSEFSRLQQIDPRMVAPPAPMPIPSDIRLTWPHVHLPPPVARYRVGRFMAGAMIGFGYIAIVAGLVMAGFAISKGGPALSLLPDLLTPGSSLVGGLLLMFAGQLARAVFDGANASREQVALFRAIADPHAHEGDRR